jgi:transcriptional regulator with XRE-family HTH domain
VTSLTLGGQRLPSLNTRIRTRRSQLGLTGAELALRAGISASYVSLIEKGAKVPDEDVAADLARALEDDETLYRSWARAARLGLHDLDLLNRLEAIARTPAYVDLVESGKSLPPLGSLGASPKAEGEAEDLRARLREVASEIGTAARSGPTAPAALAVRVPVLAEGTDPDRLRVSATSRHAVREEMLLDRRLLGPRSVGLVFAYDVGRSAMAHLRGLAAPGDRIVFREGESPGADRICAVRSGRGLVLARVLVKDRSLLLLPGEGETAFESIDVPPRVGLDRVIAGAHVLLIRR